MVLGSIHLVILCLSHLFIQQLDDGEDLYDSQFHLFSLNTRTWIVIPGHNYTDYYPMDCHFQYAHNSIFWCCENEDDYLLVSFSLITSAIRPFNMPQQPNGVNCLSIGVIMDNIVVLDYNNTHAQFWMMESFGDDHSWFVRFSIPYLPQFGLVHPNYQPYQPLYLATDGILLLQFQLSIVSYDPHTHAVTLLMDDHPFHELCKSMHLHGVLDFTIKELNGNIFILYSALL